MSTTSKLRIGRAGLTLDAEVKDLSSWSETAEGLRGSGQFLSPNETTFELLARQLTGYPNDDEPVVLIRSGSRPAFDGWWEIDDIEVSRGPSKGEWSGVGEFDIRARRIRGRSAPAIEARYDGFAAINTRGVIDGEQRHQWAVPVGAFDRNGPTGGQWTTRDTETGQLAFWHNQVASFSQALYWSPDIDTYYDGAATIEHRHDGEWFTLVGHDISRLPTDWRINNGIARVTASSNASESLMFEWWNGTGWSTPKHMAIKGDTFGTIEDPTSVSVIRNSPEECRIGLTWNSPLVSSSGRISTHLTVRRGDRTVRVAHKSDVSNQWRLTTHESSTAIDSTNLTVLAPALTAGLFTTANDADGNRAFVASHIGTTNNLGTGSVITPSDTLAVWVVGLELGGTSAVLENEWESEVLGTFGPSSELHVVRGR